MFRRHKELNIFHRTRNFFWPRSGWRRSSQYIFHRIARLPGTPYSLAAGFASGAAVSFSPFVGAHLIFAAVIAFLIRANPVAALIGTVVGNPWTFPFIWVWIYELGVKMIGSPSHGQAESLDFIDLFASIMEALLRFNLEYLFDTAWPILLPMLVGSIPTILVVWIVFYLSLRPAIETYRARRRRKTKKVRS